MKKKIIFILVLFMALSLSACGKKDDKASMDENAQKAAEVFENKSLLDWLKGGKTVECTIKSPEGNIVTTTKNDAVRMEGIPYFSMDSSGEAPKPENGVMLTVGDMTYTWDKATKKGSKMNTREMDEIYDVEERDEAEPEGWDEIAKSWDESGFDFDCKEVNVDNDLFEEPKDVDFQDLTEMMKGFADISDKMGEQAENGEPMDMAEFEKMMQELQ